MRARECPHCGTAIAVESRFCAECGRPLAPETEELGEPVLVRPAWRLWPPDPVWIIAALVGVGGVILLVGGEWAWGVAALLAAVLIVLLRTRLRGRRAAHALSHLGSRAAATREAWAARSREQVEVFRARRELSDLAAERSRLFRDLGYAVYHDDETGMNATRAALAALHDRIEEKETEIETLRRQTEERVHQARAHVEPTERLEVPPEPARVPEPWPPPDEGDLPGPPTPAPGEPAPGPEEPAPPEHPSTPMRR